MNQEPEENLTHAQNGQPSSEARIPDLLFWEKLGEDFDKGVQEFARCNGLDVSSIIAVAIAEGQNSESYKRLFIIPGSAEGIAVYRFSFPSLVRSLWRRKLQILLTAGLTILVLVTFGLIWTNIAKEKINNNIVKSREGLPAYHKITANDLGLASSFSDGQPVDERSIIGRYTLFPVQAHTSLNEGQLLGTELSRQMENRIIISIPVKSEYINSSIRPDSKIGLAFSKNGEKSSEFTLVSDLILLGMEKHADSTTLITGVRAEQLGALKDILRVADLFVIQDNPLSDQKEAEMSIRSNIEEIMFEIQSGNHDLAESIRQRAVNAIKAGEGTAPWQEYMQTFAKNPQELARLIPTDDTSDAFEMDVARTHLAGNGLCGAATTGFNLIEGIGDTLDEYLSGDSPKLRDIG
jgi:hypothetical protein